MIAWPDKTHLVLIASYNTGVVLLRTVREARDAWAPVWVVIDGSTDGSDVALMSAATGDAHLRVIRLPRNSGKGAAIHAGLVAAVQEGFTHALTFDADGQHPASHIRLFMEASRRLPHGMILGVPVFADDAPAVRVRGRRISNFWARLESGGAIADSLYGFRVYPISPLLGVMGHTRWMRHFDFDPEAAVRLSWCGIRADNVPAPVRYLTPSEGGVSHFRYVRDNLLLTFMHIRLMATALVLHLPTMLHLTPRDRDRP